MLQIHLLNNQPGSGCGTPAAAAAVLFAAFCQIKRLDADLSLKLIVEVCLFIFWANGKPLLHVNNIYLSDLPLCCMSTVKIKIRSLFCRFSEHFTCSPEVWKWQGGHIIGFNFVSPLKTMSINLYLSILWAINLFLIHPLKSMGGILCKAWASGLHWETKQQ